MPPNEMESAHESLEHINYKSVDKVGLFKSISENDKSMSID